MKIFIALLHKEALHVVRDRRTMLVILIIPILLLLLFGFAISTEVSNIRVMVVLEENNDQTAQIIERIKSNSYFNFQGVASPKIAEQQLRDGNTDATINIRQNGHKIETQIVADASNTTVAQASTLYLQSAISGNQSIPAIVNTLYNPQLKSSYNFVPGIMGMIFILICAMMTSVSIVGEKENGSMNLLIVSPAKSYYIIIGKLVPYFILSCGILAVILTIGYTLLGLPFSSSIFNVVWVSLLYILLSLSIGLLISTIVDTQLSALMVSAVIFMIPIIMFSGMIYPIDNMPQLLQWLSCIVPARWYISAMRKLMIQHLEITCVIKEIGILAGMTITILSLAIKKFTTR